MELLTKFLRLCIVWFNRLILSVYFKEVQIIGIDKVPKEGPIIFVGNHANQFIDPMAIVAYCPQHIGFMVAASTHRQRIMGFFTKTMGSIPVERPQDIAVVGKGTVSLAEDDKIIGHGSNFLKQAMVGDTIKVKGWPEYIVTEVISETELKFKTKDVNHPIKGEEMAYKVIPKVDQSQVFAKVWEELKNGKNLGIFPEGGSHDQTNLLPLKVGVAICGLGAMSKYKNAKIKVVACGLKYFNPSKFRSKMILEFSSPFEVDSKLVDEYQTDKRAACGKFLAQIEKKLRSVTFTAPNYKELKSIYLARRLYIPSSEIEGYSQEEINDLYKRFFKGYQEKRKEEEVENLMEEVYEYGAELKSLGIKDSKVYEVDFNTWDLLKKSFISLFRMVMSLIFVLPGLMTLFPMYLLNRILAEKERRKALKKSSVKVVGADVVGSTRIIYSFILYPLTCGFFTILLFILQKMYSSLSIYECLMNCFWFLVCYPIYNYVWVRSLDGVTDNWNNLFVRVYCLFSKDTMDVIRAKRENLSKKVHTVISRFGPMVFDDFDKMKLVKNLKPKAKKRKDSDRDSEVTSDSSFYQLMDQVDFDEAFNSLEELGL